MTSIYGLGETPASGGGSIFDQPPKVKGDIQQLMAAMQQKRQGGGGSGGSFSLGTQANQLAQLANQPDEMAPPYNGGYNQDGTLSNAGSRSEGMYYRPDGGIGFGGAPGGMSGAQPLSQTNPNIPQPQPFRPQTPLPTAAPAQPQPRPMVRPATPNVPPFAQRALGMFQQATNRPNTMGGMAPAQRPQAPRPTPFRTITNRMMAPSRRPLTPPAPGGGGLANNGGNPRGEAF